MSILIEFLMILPFYPGYFALFGLCFGIYFVTIGPLLFKLWIIPSIESTYGVLIRVEEENMIVPFSNWGLPAFEVPMYVFYKYIGHEPWKRGELGKFTLMHKLVIANYDINRATKAQKIVIFMSLAFFFGLIICFLVYCVYLCNEKP